ncbi:MAG: DUF3667 domain-containing protein [Longimicrobiaceae bacterium]
MSSFRSIRMPVFTERPPPPVTPSFRTTERRRPDRPCTNCGDPTPGNYCRTCGQRKVEVHVSLGRMLLEALDDQFSINSALPRTLGALLARPGHLTREYMSGRIARYIPPFRLYLVTSVLFFLALSLLPELRNPEVHLGNTVTIGGPGVEKTVHPPARPAPTAQARLAAPPVPPRPPEASWLDARVNSGNAELDSIANARLDHFRRMEQKEAVREVINGFLGRVPQMMFVLIPIFSAMLMLLYVGSKRYYVEHFVFALHVHASAFLIYLGMIALVRWPEAVSVLLGWLLLYVYLAMKKVYGQGWIVTGIKYGVLGIGYVCLLALGAFLTLLATVFLA